MKCSNYRVGYFYETITVGYYRQDRVTAGVGHRTASTIHLAIQQSAELVWGLQFLSFQFSRLLEIVIKALTNIHDDFILVWMNNLLVHLMSFAIDTYVDKTGLCSYNPVYLLIASVFYFGLGVVAIGNLT